MKHFSVFFRQVNQTRYEIEALNAEDAIKIAEQQWKEEFSNPELLEVEE